MSTKCSHIFTLILFSWSTVWAGATSSKPPFQLYQPASPPFWQKKASAQARVYQKKEILVSVTSDERKLGEQKLKQLFLKGVGLVDVSRQKGWEKIHRFESLRDLSPEHFLAINFDEAKQQLFIHGVAMTYHAKMLLQLFDEKNEAEKWSRLHFKIISGSFRGMVGYVQLMESPRQSEFSMTAFYESEKLPLPSFLLSFGLEAVMRVVASKMRRYLETEAVKADANLVTGEPK